MSIPIFEACRKRKRRPKIFGFHTFADPGIPINPIGPFRDNIRIFLQEAAEFEDYRVEEMKIWCTLLLLENRSFVIPLYTIEENVKQSSRSHCDQCRCSGWSNHFVSKRKYHLIIPSDGEWNKALEDGVFDSNSHLLHGLIHCNGFGHLLCLNGIEGGSKYLCGREIMDLWDRICSILRTRKITVEDMSRKHSMDLRLLYGVAYGHSWFGRWGYGFCRGSFGVKQHNYDRAIEVLCSLELDKVIQDLSNSSNCREINQIIRYYRDMSETQLITLRELFKFMLTIKFSLPKKLILTNPKPSTRLQKKQVAVKERSLKFKKFSSVVANMDSRWPARRLEFTAEVIANALKEKKAMTRQDVRDAARLHIGDTGLLDYVLKSLNSVMIGNHVVRRSVNPLTRILEYTIHDVGNEVSTNEPEHEPENFPSPDIELGAGAGSGAGAGGDVYSDLVYLYTNALLNYPETEPVELAAQVVLDSKQMVKEWKFCDDKDHLLRFICQVLPCLSDLETEFTRELPPGEIVVVPLYATVWDLKRAAEKALRDTYCITETFAVTEIGELEGMEDREVLFGSIESGVNIWVKGNGIDLRTRLRYEGGAGNWMVKCECGARDDDGERMVACDICETWQHTRCCGIDDSENVPPLFVCKGCCLSLVPPRNELLYGENYSDHTNS